jgi:hypothetical protein
MKFLTVFTLRIKHRYYADTRCRDLQIEPTGATERFLKDQRCIVKLLPDGNPSAYASRRQRSSANLHAWERDTYFSTQARAPEFSIVYRNGGNHEQVGAAIHEQGSEVE